MGEVERLMVGEERRRLCDLWFWVGYIKEFLYWDMEKLCFGICCLVFASLHYRGTNRIKHHPDRKSVV